jgi:trans-L-3-hydroxyproline dehydratase
MARYKNTDELLEKHKTIHCVDMHTAGEPLRIVISGYPDIKGNTILEKRQYAKEELDVYRKTIMFEPKGHSDMYGLIRVDKERDNSDFGVLFMHNEGYSTMCGHATLAITKFAIEFGWVNSVEGENSMLIDAPCGQIKAYALVENGEVCKTWFQGVPSFVVALDEKIEMSSLGNINYDLAYGGAFYAYVNADQIGLDLLPENYQRIQSMGMLIKQAIMKQKSNIVHPFESELSFLYGVIFIGGPVSDGVDSRNVCIFADGEVDRCPTGSGVSGRMAILAQREELNEGDYLKIESILGTVFKSRYSKRELYGPYPSVIPEVHGDAYYSGVNSFILDEKDPLHEGFILK